MLYQLQYIMCVFFFSMTNKKLKKCVRNCDVFFNKLDYFESPD